MLMLYSTVVSWRRLELGIEEVVEGSTMIIINGHKEEGALRIELTDVQNSLWSRWLIPDDNRRCPKPPPPGTMDSSSANARILH